MQVETPNQGSVSLTNVIVDGQECLGKNNLRPQLTESSQIGDEIQAWTQIFEQRSNDRITKMKEEMENKLDAILKEIRTNKSNSTVTNPRSEINEMQPLGSKSERSIGVSASNNDNSDSEDDDYPLKAQRCEI